MLPSTGKISMVDVWRELNPPMDPKDCDYYFETVKELRDKIDLGFFHITSDQSIGFSDNVKSLDGLSYYDIERYNSNPVPSMIVARNVTSFAGFFAGTDIKTVPEKFFYNCPNAENFTGCFEYCGNLKEIPEKIFYNCPNATDFSNCFHDCGLEKIPEKLFFNNRKATNFSNCFSQQGSRYGKFTNIPNNLFYNCVNAENFNECFSFCYLLKSVPQGLFDKNVNAINFNSCFSGCSSIISVPQDLFDKCINATDFGLSFCECSSITSSLPDVWNKAKFPKVTNGNIYAYNCTKASNYNEIPSNFGGPSTNPEVPLSIKQKEEPINNQKIITKSIERIVDDRLPDGPIALGDIGVRELANINNGQISLNDLHGKSNEISCIVSYDYIIETGRGGTWYEITNIKQDKSFLNGYVIDIASSNNDIPFSSITFKGISSQFTNKYLLYVDDENSGHYIKDGMIFIDDFGSSPFLHGMLDKGYIKLSAKLK